ncbi:Pentatricopeptide repeat-containing protein [Platanthera zijinensis]|uniref:Pentatricopeptide repeat-containing protein n=1 Tax=Platanthera zijinensis TaxID=2320716 RepID=A0AAP0G695_9ASPA
MYCRYGCVEAALEVFRRVSSKDVVLWNVMIGGLAMHGHDRLVVDLFALIKETTTTPNESTYIAAMLAQTVHIVLVILALVIVELPRSPTSASFSGNPLPIEDHFSTHQEHIKSVLMPLPLHNHRFRPSLHPSPSFYQIV